MFTIIKPGTNIDFLGKSKTFLLVSTIAVIVALVLISLRLKLGLDFSGGHEILVAFDKEVDTQTIRAKLQQLNLGDTSVQSYEIPGTPEEHYLVRVQRSQTFGTEEIAALEKGFKDKYGAHFLGPVR